MNTKRLILILFFTIIIFGNPFLIIEGSALTYSNPSTTPVWSYSSGNRYISAVAISSDGSYITATSENLVYDISIKANGTLFLFDNSNSTTKIPLWNYSISNSFYSLAISGNGSYIVAGGGYVERTVYLFNNSTPTPEWAYSTNGWVYDIAISDNDDYIAAASGDHRKAFFFNATESIPIKGYSTTGLTIRVAISSNGSFMAATDNAAKLYFFNTSNNSPEWTFTLSGDMSTSLSISADGNYIASGGDKVYVFRKNSSIPLWTNNAPDHVSSIKISQDGSYIVAGGDYRDTKVYLFNRNNSIPKWTYSTKSEITSVAISSNGDYIVALTRNYWIYLFNKSSSTPIWRYRLDGYTNANYDSGLEISSDGKYIVVGGRHRIYLFDRDIITAPMLIIPGYNLFVIFLMIGIMLLSSVISLFLKYKKEQRNLSTQFRKNMLIS